MITSTNGKKALNLVASIAVTALLILGWHLAVPSLGEIKPVYRMISYSIILFGATWILDAVFAFYTASKVEKPEKRVMKIMTARAVVGFIVFLVYAAMVHGMVAVLFTNDTHAAVKDMMFKTPSIAKDGLAFIGFCVFLSNSLSVLTKRTWTGFAYGAVAAIGVLLSLAVKNPDIVVAVMAAITFVIAMADAVMAFKKAGVSSTKFIVTEVVYLLVLSAVLFVRYWFAKDVPVDFAHRYKDVAISGAISFAIAVVIDIVVIVVAALTGGKTGDGLTRFPA